MIYLECTAFALDNVMTQMLTTHDKSEKGHSGLLRSLDPKQRKVLEL